MKAILKFDLSEEGDRREYKAAIKSYDMLRALHDVKDLLRNWEGKCTILALPNGIEKLREEVNTIIYERVGEI